MFNIIVRIFGNLEYLMIQFNYGAPHGNVGWMPRLVGGKPHLL
jgi:hypothetical protein